MVTTVLAEALGPFQMTYASFDEARAAVHELDSALREHAAVISRARDRLDRMQQTAAVRRRLFADIVTAQEQERIRDRRRDPRRRAAGDGRRPAAAGAAQGRPGRAHTIPWWWRSWKPASATPSARYASSSPASCRTSSSTPGWSPRSKGCWRTSPPSPRSKCVLDLASTSEPHPEQRTIAFRVTQEALANARMHASAFPHRCAAGVTRRRGGRAHRRRRHRLGRGSRARAGHVAGRMGLAAMSERVELAGGWLRIDSGTEGTAVSFWIPDGGENGASA